MPKYVDSARTVQDKDEVIQSQAICIKENGRTILTKEEENQQLRQQLQQESDRQQEEREQHLQQENQQLRQIQQENMQALREKLRQIEEKDRQLGCVNQQLEASERVVAQFERRIAKLEQQLSQREQQKTKANSKGKQLIGITLRWREGKRAPCKMSKNFDTVVDGNTVYIRYGESVKIYSYDVTSDSWCQLPDCVRADGSITITNGWLTTIGGYYHCVSNELFSLTGEGSNRKWTEKFPPMPTERSDTSALCTKTSLVVAGGMGEVGMLSTVEVMNTENHQWSTAADLPQPIYCASATVCGDQLYMLGGVNKHYSDTTPVQ